MIVRRYGSKVHSVEPDFSSVALTEIAFRRDHEWSLDAAEFDAAYERVDVQEFTASGAGDIQTNVENEVLQTLLADLHSLESAAAEGDLLMVENELAKDF